MMDENIRKAWLEEQMKIQKKLENIKHRVVVFSGKGGVGKTTVAVNLAIALGKLGKKVGLLDADITGPNTPKMLGLNEQLYAEEGEIIPHEIYGIKVVSLGLIVPEDQPVVWRGPLRTKAINQFVTDVRWDELDYLIIDLPPGTGDEVITVAQNLKPTAAIVVTTPQEVAVMDAKKAINLAKTLQIGYIGVIENMSGLICPHCGNIIEIFGKGGGLMAARKFNVDFLGEIPMEVDVRIGGDSGMPVVVKGKGKVYEAFREIAEKLIKKLEED